jgi:hypothetical protein
LANSHSPTSPRGTASQESVPPRDHSIPIDILVPSTNTPQLRELQSFLLYLFNGVHGIIKLTLPEGK